MHLCRLRILASSYRVILIGVWSITFVSLFILTFFCDRDFFCCVYFSNIAPALTTDSLGCREITLPTEKEGKFQASGSIVTFRSSWSPKALAVPIKVCNCRDGSYCNGYVKIVNNSDGKEEMHGGIRDTDCFLNRR